MKKKFVKKFLQHNIFITKILLIISKWQYSFFPPLRWVGKLLSLPFYYAFKEHYYSAVALAYEVKLGLKKPQKSKPLASYLPNISFVKMITGDRTVTPEEYVKLLSRVQFSAEKQIGWAQSLMGFGRLDLAEIGFLDILNRNQEDVAPEMRLLALRYLGIVCFLQGKNGQANHYWYLTGQLRRCLFKPTTPRRYKILGPSWFASFGHVCMLDYYLKYLKLYCEDKDLRIVANKKTCDIPGLELMKFFMDLGIEVVQPEDLEKDYNEWAAKNGYHSWEYLSSSEQAAMIEDFWEYDFPDRETLGFAHAIAKIQQTWEDKGNKPLFILSEKEKQWIDDYTVNLGIPKGSWYICLHVREEGYHKNWNKLYPSMRDANIEDYYPAIESIVKAGGWVLRMGDPSMKPLPAMSKVIDYAHSSLRTPLADILLAAGAKFLLGTNSGYANICSMYNVPCALTNWVPIGWPLWLRQDLMIPKLFRNKDTNKFLTLEEVFEANVAFLQNWSDLPLHIELVANTPEEISDLTLEMLEECMAGDFQINIAKSKVVFDRYTQIAKKYGAFTGSRLGSKFINKHIEIFRSCLDNHAEIPIREEGAALNKNQEPLQVIQ